MGIKWNSDELRLGVEEIDAQHEEVYARVSEILGGLRVGRHNEFLELLSCLERYFVRHFATEERLMAESAYPGMGSHMALHRGLLRTCRRHAEVFWEQGGATSALIGKVADWLTTWLGEHLRGADRDLATFLQSSTCQRAGTAPGKWSQPKRSEARP
ncbi:MAG TPA: hemerythrin domain-containing protein [Anaeromyxobacteraceae bacterium]|nr:hemerythrin domain-containing protein [Anaeromyxobacteraceae bacterium]